MYQILFFLFGSIIAIFLKKFIWNLFTLLELKMLPIVAFFLKFKKRKEPKHENNITFDEEDI